MTASDSASPNIDVRMRGFTQRATVEAATAWIDGALPEFSALPATLTNLADATGRILAADVISPINVPGFARSMMDGFAVRGEDTYGATPYNALPLRICGTCLPGIPYGGTLVPGEAVRIMTGAPLPAGADAVLPVEQTEVDSLHVGAREVLARGEVSTGKHVAQIGEDVRAGETILPAKRKLRPQDLGVLSSVGIGQVDVVRAPRVRILITGNELLPAGTPPSGFRVADANGPMLSALVARDGGDLTGCDMIQDDPDTIRAALRSPVDIILVSGGSSVGLEDHAPRLLAQEGELAIHGISMRPSSPAGMGRIGRCLVFLLPGNPVSCLCAYDFFAGRAVRGLAGKSRDWPYKQMQGTLARKLVSTVGRVDYARVCLHGDQIEPLAISGASILSSTTRADGFVIVPADSEGYPPGAIVNVFLYD